MTSNRSLSASTAHQNYFCLCLLVGMDGEVWNKQPEGMTKQVLPTSPLEEQLLKPSKPWRSHDGRWDNPELAEGLGSSKFPGDLGCNACLTSASHAIPTRNMCLVREEGRERRHHQGVKVPWEINTFCKGNPVSAMSLRHLAEAMGHVWPKHSQAASLHYTDCFSPSTET